ncbi:MAG: two-component system response regulator [Salinisphaeraceae bacterium]|nr:two-component system response regulator [Salinisphaeraceae bacterium]
MTMLTPEESPPAARVLLIDDDAAFLQAMTRSLARHGCDVQGVADPAQAMAVAPVWQPDYCLLDLNLEEPTSGMDLIEPLLAALPDLNIVVLTGYASLATAVAAIKRGARDYLAKPVDAQTVLLRFGLAEPASMEDGEAVPMSLKRLEWEHINRVLADHDGNVSAAARSLGLYRRTLQRKLDKKPVKQ